MSMNLYRAWKKFTPHTRTMLAKLAGIDPDTVTDDLTQMSTQARFEIKKHLHETGLVNRFSQYHREVGKHAQQS